MCVCVKTHACTALCACVRARARPIVLERKREREREHIWKVLRTCLVASFVLFFSASVENNHASMLPKTVMHTVIYTFPDISTRA